jgi:serine/threonine protein phosphatase 1
MFERLPWLRGKHRPAAIPRGYRVYAIGDIHGRDDLLADLLAKIEADRAERAERNIVLIFLGDLIDRGPASAEVIERLRTYAPAATRLVFLAGNHEEVLLRLLDGQSELLGDWLRFGGAECLRSYGVEPRSLARMSPREAVKAIRAAVPGAHREFLSGFADTFRIGGYLFVHAGIRPGLPLASQTQSDLRWIRQTFLDDRSDHGFVVIHGHTISERVDEQTNRIGVDTGAYHSGVLTAIALEGTERWYLQTGAEPGEAR